MLTMPSIVLFLLRTQAEAACKGGIRTSDSTVQKASMDSSWENLRPVSISELKLFQTMKGRRLNCQVVGSPNHSVGITTILQDSAGTVVVSQLVLKWILLV